MEKQLIGKLELQYNPVVCEAIVALEGIRFVVFGETRRSVWAFRESDGKEAYKMRFSSPDPSNEELEEYILKVAQDWA
jgi:hypothetical protein